jgi:cation:H+ antiporter
VDLLPFILLGVGLALLVSGAELLVSGASALARTFGVGPTVIGLTVVAFGTSSPELAVSLGASLAGEPDVALGNVVGSNIYNVLLILGLSALVAPLAVDARLVRRDVPVMIVVSVVTLVLAADGVVGRLDGLILFGGLMLWLIWSVREARANGRIPAGTTGPEAQPLVGGHPPGPRRAVSIGRIAVGLVLLGVGAQGLVQGAVALAAVAGVSPLVVGLTVVAVGTSLPEMATSIVASRRRESDISVGNVVGSNIFNLGSVLGIAALISPISVAPAALALDLPVMVGVAAACLPLFFTGTRISRWEGALLVAYALAYTSYLLLDATGHPAASGLREVLVAVVLPLTILTLAVFTVREVRARWIRRDVAVGSGPATTVPTSGRPPQEVLTASREVGPPGRDLSR